jgi:hypothetical protein
MEEATVVAVAFETLSRTSGCTGYVRFIGCAFEGRSGAMDAADLAFLRTW